MHLLNSIQHFVILRCPIKDWKKILLCGTLMIQSGNSVWAEQKQLPPMEHNSEIVAAGYTDDDNILITSSSDGIVKIWDANYGNMVRALGVRLPPSKDFVAEISPDGKLIATVYGRVGKVWNTKFGESTFLLTGHRDTANAIHFSSNSNWVVTSCLDGSAKLWEVQTGKRHHILNHMMESLEMKDATSGITDAKFCNNDQWLITGSNRRITNKVNRLGYDSISLIWDLKTGKVVRTIYGYPFALDKKSKRVITGSVNTTENRFRIWDISNGQIIQSIDSHSGKINCTQFSQNGKLFLTASYEDGSCRLWDGQSYTLVLRLNTPIVDDPNAAQFSPDGKLIATFSGDSSKVWETASGKLKFAIASDLPIVFAHDSQKIVVMVKNQATQREALTAKVIPFFDTGSPLRQKKLKVR